MSTSASATTSPSSSSSSFSPHAQPTAAAAASPPFAPTKEGQFRVVLGTMTFGPAIGSAHADGSKNNMPAYCQTPPDVAEAQIKLLLSKSKIKHGPEAGKALLDTASAYQNGYTERVLGSIIAKLGIRNEVSIHTKVNNMQKPHASLSNKSVTEQLDTSLESLQTSYVDILYLHSPDINTDISDTLDAIQAAHEKKKIIEFGLSNFPAWKVVDIYYRCKARGMVLPTVYQGCYNALTRGIEFEATAAFRELGIRSYHYNPLAGGLLSGKYDAIDSVLKESGRFGAGSPISGAAYSQRYWHQAYFNALNVLRTACDKAGISMAAASLRWLVHHSILSAAHNDGIIIGASSLSHCSDNLTASVESGPLPSELVDAFDQAWEIAKPSATPYFRGYGTLSGISDTFIKKYQTFVPKSTI